MKNKYNGRRICGHCNKSRNFKREIFLCNDCVRLEDGSMVIVGQRKYAKRDELIAGNDRLAKCGHPSISRYFKCEQCQPVLPSDMGAEYDSHDDNHIEMDEFYE